MNLVIERESVSPYSTQGSLFVDGVFYGYTLELPWRNNQPDISCVPPGTYPVAITESPRLGFETPELSGVPDRADIRIHPANWPKDITGCIGVGFQRGADAVYSSRAAFATLMQKLRLATDAITLRIEDQSDLQEDGA